MSIVIHQRSQYILLENPWEHALLCLLLLAIHISTLYWFCLIQVGSMDSLLRVFLPLWLHETNLLPVVHWCWTSILFLKFTRWLLNLIPNKPKINTVFKLNCTKFCNFVICDVMHGKGWWYVEFLCVISLCNLCV